MKTENAAWMAARVLAFCAAAVTSPHALGDEISAGTVTATNHVRQTSNVGSNYFMGPVGIGEDSPQALLHGKGATYSETLLLFDNYLGNEVLRLSTLFGSSSFSLGEGDVSFQTGGHATFKGDVTIGATNSPSRVTFYANKSVSWPINIVDAQGNPMARLACSVAPAYAPEWHLYDTNATLRVRLNTDGTSFLNGGNIGIGTNSPSEALHVAGKGRFEQGIAYIPAMGDLSMGTYTNQP